MADQDCIFCKIVAGEVPSDIVYRDEHVTAFRDINPQAPVHVLVVPNRHIATVADITADDELLMGHLIRVATLVAEREQIHTPDRGYRLVLNYGKDGGLLVHHVHLHVLGGRRMGWPPG